MIREKCGHKFNRQPDLYWVGKGGMSSTRCEKKNQIVKGMQGINEKTSGKWFRRRHASKKRALEIPFRDHEGSSHTDSSGSGNPSKNCHRDEKKLE